MYQRLGTLNGLRENMTDETFLSGRCAKIYLAGKEIGIMGVLHPVVIEKFDLSCPASILEFNFQSVVKHHLGR